MEAIQNSIQALTDHFNTQMEEFQRSLQVANPTTSPTSDIAGQFHSFRAFVMSALAGLQQQVELLAKQTDQIEMRSRRKMLLVHGVPEGNNDNLSTTVTESLSKNLKLPDFQEHITRCQRLGQPREGKSRAILLKFRDIETRNQVWFAKTALKNTGITLSEFLTKDRHDAFMAARQKFGVSKCWTRDGVIVVIGQDGKRHRVTAKAEVDSISGASSDSQAPAAAAVASNAQASTSQSVAAKVVKPSTVRTPSKQRRAAVRGKH